MDQSAFILRTTALLLLVACVTGRSTTAAVVTSLPDATIITPDVYVDVGEGIDLLCLNVSGARIMNWMKDWKIIDLERSSPRVTEESDVLSSILKISRARLSDTGNYTCRQDFENGRLYVITSVHIQDPISSEKIATTTPPSSPSTDDVPHKQLLKAVTDMVAGLKDINLTLRQAMGVLMRRS